MNSSLRLELDALQNPEPLEFNVDESDSEDVTRAQLVSGFSRTTEEEDVSFTPTLRHKSVTFMDEKDSRYKGRVVTLSELESVSEEEEEENDEKEDTEKGDQFDLNMSKRLNVETDSADDTVAFESDASGLDESEDAESDSEEEEEEDSANFVRSFTQVDVDQQIAKAKAVQQQLRLSEQLLGARIRFQRILSLANQLPHDSAYREQLIAAEPSLGDKIANCHSAVSSLLDELLNLQDILFSRNHCTANLSTKAPVVTEQRAKDGTDSGLSDADDDEVEMEKVELPKKRRCLSLEKYSDLTEQLHSAFMPYRNQSLEQWYEKTRMANIKSSHKDFSGFEFSILKQIDYILSDKDRLRRRTQIKRSEYSCVGESDSCQDEGNNEDVIDAEIFDDDDFYEQLLRELIHRSAGSSTDPLVQGRQWAKLQKLRTKRKRKPIDRRASKGRAIRYHVISKLVNFMAPVDRCKMSEDARAELFSSIFSGSRSIDVADV
uniref:Uncharacterized protein n=2 Tax=Trichuris muris TaxID=70415 RepID=A0A5S6QXL8_TRIMR